MPDRSRNGRPKDENEIAAGIVRQATKDDVLEDDEELRRQAARILGRRGGLKGGPARKKALSKKRRSEIARKAAETRWKKQTESS